MLSTFVMGAGLAGASGGVVLCVDEGVGRGACMVGEGRGSSTPRVTVGMGGDFEVYAGMMKVVGERRDDELLQDL